MQRCAPANRSLVAPLCMLMLASCSEATPAPPLELSVTWGLTGTSTLPDDVTDIEIITCTLQDQVETCDPTTCSVEALTLTRAEGPVEGCRPSEGTEMYGSDPVLVRRDLPTQVPIRFRLNGLDSSGDVLYAGQAGPFALGEGQRRYQPIRMYPVGVSVSVSGSGGFEGILHTSTYLPDGRVLIAGGFSTATALSTCPSALGVSDEATCIHLEATDEALILDVATGALEPLREPMLTARGGHSATALPDGRVLLAGGSSEAILAMIPQGTGAASGFTFLLQPVDRVGASTAHATFEVFDAARAGGYGVYRAGAGNALSAARSMPGAVSVQDTEVWIIGGGLAQSNDDLADIWTFSDTDPNGSVEPASTATSFPQFTPGGSDDYPEYSLTRPSVAAIDGGQRVLAVGWFGPRCSVGGNTPVFYSTTTPTEACDAPGSGATRSFTAAASSGVTSPTIVRPHAFGSAAPLIPFDPAEDGLADGIAVTGGTQGRSWGPQPAIDVFSGEVDATGSATLLGATANLASRRFFHSTAAVPGYGFVTSGGVIFATAGLDRVSFQSDVEIVFLDL